MRPASFYWRGFAMVLAVGIALGLVAVLLGGCATAPAAVAGDHGVPNLAEVEPGVYRGGQPTPEGWQWLRDHGVTTVVKLNTWDEAPEDAPPTMEVRYLPVTLAEQLFHVPAAQIDRAVDVMQADRFAGVFVHCEHGQDRTGLVVACFRVRVMGWSKDEARAEMMQRGFHPALGGLQRAWDAEWEPWRRGM